MKRLLYIIDFLFGRKCWRYRSEWRGYGGEYTSKWVCRSVAYYCAMQRDQLTLPETSVIEYRHQPFRKTRPPEVIL